LGLRSRIYGRSLSYFVKFCGSPLTKEKNPERFRKMKNLGALKDGAGLPSGRFGFD